MCFLVFLYTILYIWIFCALHCLGSAAETASGNISSYPSIICMLAIAVHLDGNLTTSVKVTVNPMQKSVN